MQRVQLETHSLHPRSMVQHHTIMVRHKSVRACMLFFRNVEQKRFIVHRRLILSECGMVAEMRKPLKRCGRTIFPAQSGRSENIILQQTTTKKNNFDRETKMRTGKTGFSFLFLLSAEFLPVKSFGKPKTVFTLSCCFSHFIVHTFLPQVLPRRLSLRRTIGICFLQASLPEKIVRHRHDATSDSRWHCKFHVQVMYRK